jgi:hypothetical protein
MIAVIFASIYQIIMFVLDLNNDNPYDFVNGFLGKK